MSLAICLASILYFGKPRSSRNVYHVIFIESPVLDPPRQTPMRPLGPHHPVVRGVEVQRGDGAPRQHCGTIIFVNTEFEFIPLSQLTLVFKLARQNGLAY